MGSPKVARSPAQKQVPRIVLALDGLRKNLLESCSCFRRVVDAVVAKPPGTRTPAADNSPIISPSDAFLPPTRATSVTRKVSSEIIRSMPRHAPLRSAVPGGGRLAEYPFRARRAGYDALGGAPEHPSGRSTIRVSQTNMDLRIDGMTALCAREGVRAKLVDPRVASEDSSAARRIVSADVTHGPPACEPVCTRDSPSHTRSNEPLDIPCAGTRRPP